MSCASCAGSPHAHTERIQPSHRCGLQVQFFSMLASIDWSGVVETIGAPYSTESRQPSQPGQKQLHWMCADNDGENLARLIAHMHGCADVRIMCSLVQHWFDCGYTSHVCSSASMLPLQLFVFPARSSFGWAQPSSTIQILLVVPGCHAGAMSQF